MLRHEVHNFLMLLIRAVLRLLARSCRIIRLLRSFVDHV